MYMQKYADVYLNFEDGFLCTDSPSLISLNMTDTSYMSRLEDGLYVTDLTQIGGSVPPDDPVYYEIAKDTQIFESPDEESEPFSTVPETKVYQVDEIREETKKWGYITDLMGWVILTGDPYVPPEDPSQEEEEPTNNTNENTASTDEETEYPCGVVETKEDTYHTGSEKGLYCVKLKAGTIIYNIDDQNNITQKSTITQKQSKYFYTIDEEKTIDTTKFGFKRSDGWIVIDPNVQPEPGEDPVYFKGIDNYTITEFNSKDTIKTNPSVVQHIYAMATQRIIARSTNGISSHTNVPKNKADVLSELNWLYYSGMEQPITHHLRKKDLLCFYTYTNHRPPAYDLSSDVFADLTQRSESCETLERSPNTNIICNAIFVIDDIQYTDNNTFTFPIKDITLTCFWTDGTIGEFGKVLDNISKREES